MAALALVEQVKKLQRESEEWKQAWWQYCALSGNNTRDPAAHTPEFLQAFLDQPNLPTLNLDEITKVEDPSDHAALVERIKIVQKTSPEGKLAWVAWCTQKPNGSRDPNLHEPDFLAGFLGSLKQETLAAWSPPAEVKDGKQPLVDQIKSVQRTPEGKEAWAAWCAHYGGGSRDPTVHDASFLQQFLRTQGLMPGKRPAAAIVAGGKGKGKGGFFEDPAAREELTGLIKAAQRESEEFRYAWAEYCAMFAGNSRDPNLHDLASLQGFVAANTHLIPPHYGYGAPVPPAFPMAKRGRFMGGPAYPPHAPAGYAAPPVSMPPVRYPMGGPPAGLPGRPPRGPFTSVAAPQPWANGGAVPRGRPYYAVPHGKGF